MAEVVVMPKLGFNMSEGKLVKWYKSEGDEIRKGEPFFSVETDKTNIDIEATGDGIVRKLFIQEGDVIEVTLPIAIVAQKDEDISDILKDIGRTLEPEKAEEPKAVAQSKDNAKEINTSPKMDYEVIVIGGGPGGYVAAIKSAQAGKKTCIIEKNKFGGTCLNVGCIPTKALLRSVESLREVKECASFGVINIDTENAALDLKKVQERKTNIIGQLVGGVNGLLRANKVEVINGSASFVDKNTIAVGNKEITGENIIIATGSSAKSLPIQIDKDARLLTSKEALDLSEAPEDIVIIGGGVIGVEFAYFLASIGTKVTIVEFLDRILPMVDEEITDQVVKKLEGIGINIHTSAKVTEIKKNAVLFEKNSEINELNTQAVLMSVGRVPNFEGLNVEAAGIRIEKGAIVANEYLETNVNGIYAIGDVNGKSMLAHTASMEGIIAVENICGNKMKMDYSKIPSAIYIQPEIASVGLTEKEAVKKYGEVKVGRFPLLANGKAKVEGQEQGLIKVIIESRLNEIVGVHMYSIHATDMISELVLAMRLEATAEEIAQAVHPHPTVSEIIPEAFHAALNKAIHFM